VFSIFRRMGRRPSPASVLALVAVVLAVSGTAIALPGGKPVSTKAGDALDYGNLKLTFDWISGPAGTFKPQAAKDNFGVVHLRGGVEGGTAQQAFRLPKGLRPKHAVVMTVYGGGPEPATLDVHDDGKGFLIGATTSFPASASLDGVTFSTK
jgi:hypothetical protein